MQEQASAGFWLSPQQRFAWKIEQESLRASSRAVCLVSLEGPVEIERLRDALRSMVSRHEILRTVFRRQTGMKVPFQVVLESAEFGWRQLDVSSLSPSERQSQIQKLFEQERTTEISLEDGPTLRAVLINSAVDSFALILSVSSLGVDAKSLQLLVRELGLAYSQAALPEPFRYVQFAQWQADLLESDEEDARLGRDFWAKQQAASLVGPSVGPSLPLEKRQTENSFQPKTFASRISAELGSTILQRPDSSAFLLAAWEILLARLSGKSAFSIGFLAGSREYEELENAIGFFARTVPLAARIESDFSFSDVLRRAGEAMREAASFQEYFLPEAIEADTGLVAFAYHDLGEKQLNGELGFTLERLQVVSERFKLRLVAMRRVTEKGSELELEFGYDASRLEHSAVERIAGYYENLLAAAMANPETAVSRLPLLSGLERRQLVVEWNQTAAEYPEVKNQCLHELFEQQAARVPDRMAVRCGDQSFTYRELNERANQLAHYLRKNRVGPDRPVGLCLERSAETMVAVLAILKAGGAYVPLNPDNPPARLQQQLEGAAAVITKSKLAAQMPEFSGAVMVLDRDQQLWAKEATSNPARNTTPENLVYVIYTSGSTGVPKGVAVRHHNLVNYASFISKRLELEKYPEGLQFATVSTLGADLGNTCIYPSLISGGGLHIVGYDMATDPQRFAEYVSQYPIDVLKIVPSHLQALVQSGDAATLLPRKYLIFGGETLTPKLLDRIESLNPSCEILNHYGPTETTVGSLTLKLKDYDYRKAGLASLPIGRPIANTQVYILDANLEPVPVGVTGELYIAGAGVTAGYLGQPEKTAERFVTNPFVSSSNSNSSNPNSTAETKMYRTGDLARYGEDGNIEFMGRGDDQVKIRGFRIELGEIEAVLSRHASVKQVVVLAREDEQGDKRLLAYVVPGRDSSSKTEITGEDLRAYLKQQLPDYMVPQAVVILAKLPLTANGKIDRQALPEPEQASQSKAYVAPKTSTEKVITEIWAEVLRRDKDKISVDDNFFDLGGHSLLATQVISRVRERFSVEIPMRIMFDQPKVAGLAEAVEQAPKNASNAEEITIAPVAREAYRA